MVMLRFNLNFVCTSIRKNQKTVRDKKFLNRSNCFELTPEERGTKRKNLNTNEGE